MSILVVGLNHRTAPVGLLERLSISEEMLPKALHQLSTYDHVLEGVVLSTCNRVEVYAAVSRFHGGAQDLRNLLAEFCHVAPEDFADHLYTYHEDGAVAHLFRVVAGIDSMVVGESEILGQVRRAYQGAVDHGTVQRTLGRAFRQALHVGKRARTETAIARNAVSISSAAVDLARRAFSNRSLSNKRVIIVGAGKMGGLAMRALARAGARDVTIVNRTGERARDLGGAFGAAPRPMEELADAIGAADIVISSTTAPQVIIERSMVERAIGSGSSGHPLLMIDIAMPRDIDPSVAEVEGVVLRDIEDLRGVVEGNVGSRLGEVIKVERIIAEEVDRFVQWERAGEIAPTVSALVAAGEEIRRSELRRMGVRFRALSPEEQEAVDQVTARIVAKLLHRPIEKAKAVASSKQGQGYLTALRDLFGLDEEPEPWL
jgi:glutamyl-tRNA reductase